MDVLMKAHLMFTARLVVLALAVPMILVGCQEDLALTERSFACESDADCVRDLICGADGWCVSPDAAPTPTDVSDVTDAPETTEEVTDPCSDTCPELGLVDCDLSTGENFRTCLEVEGCEGLIWSESESGCVIGGQECVKAGSLNPKNPCQDCRPEDFGKGYLSAADGAECAGADLCMDGMTCSSGVCQGGTSRTCDDELSCTDDSCTPETGECLFELQEGFCTIGDACVASGSVEERNECLSCDPAQSTSDWSPVAADTLCEDGDACTEGDTCAQGLCSPGSATVCGDENPCTEDLCDPDSGCSFPPAGPDTSCGDAFPHGQGLCSDTVCVPSCDAGHKSCDETWENGCEVSTSSDPDNCGECGTVCDEGWFCLEGQCSNSCGDKTPCGEICVNLDTDPMYCGACDAEPCDGGEVGEVAVCVEGACGTSPCEEGLWDINGEPTDGCEYACVVTGDETCDGVDNDCDGLIDEDFSLESDSEHCGACNQACQDASVTEATCVDSACAVVLCEEGLYDADGEWGNGCEYGCVVAGDETCNGLDDDCDGAIDESHQCGAETTDTVGVCADGVCSTAPCETDTWNVDGEPSTGCEYSCVKTSEDDLDGCGWGDEDCDGETDEDGENCPPEATAVVGVYATDGAYGANCALRGDGSVWCWGNGWSGQIGRGIQQENVSTPVPVLKVYDPPEPLSGIVAMDSSNFGSCAIDGDGQTHCWGITRGLGMGDEGGTHYVASATIPDTDGVTPLQGLVSIAQTQYGGCGVMDDKTARCWGTNAWGSLGNNTSDASSFSLPVVVLGADGLGPLQGVVKMAAGLGHNYKEHRCAILEDETLWCWGRNQSGQLGIGVSGAGFESEPLPVQTLGPYGGLLEGVKDVDCGYGYCCAVASNPFDADITQAFCWGLGTEGQLGQGSPSHSSLPVGVVTDQLGTPLAGLTSISAGNAHACATTEEHKVFCWGNGKNGELADPDAGIRPWAALVPGLEDAVGVAASDRNTCAWTAQGEAYCWGSNAQGHLGLGFHAPSIPVPQAVPGLEDVAEVEVGYYQTCARSTGGTTTCWGDNEYGQLGVGSTTSRSMPTEPVQTADGTPIVLESLAVGGQFACGISPEGVLCWGHDGFGQLGDGVTIQPSENPWVIPDAGSLLTEVTSLSPGYGHVCGLDGDGGVLCWGDGGWGQMGNDEKYSSNPTPKQVLTEDGSPLAGATDVFSGTYHSCALAGPSGDVWCWGSNDKGQVGDGGLEYVLTARQVKISEDSEETLSGGGKMGLGKNFSCITTQGGQEVWCWGDDSQGQLGNDALSTAMSPYPVKVSIPQGLTISDLAAGNQHVCALSTTGKLFCWGDGSYGQLGSGSTVDATAPFGVPALFSKEIVGVDCGNTTTCAVDAEGGAWCWGQNYYGQVGNGAAWVLEPTKVVGLDEL